MSVNVNLLRKIIEWASAAAKEHVEIARHNGETPDPEPSMGLWQSFQATFPKEGGKDYDSLVQGYGYDLMVATYSHVYTQTVKALTAFKPAPRCSYCKEECQASCAKCGTYV